MITHEKVLNRIDYIEKDLDDYITTYDKDYDFTLIRDYIVQQQKKDKLLELYRRWHDFIAESNNDKTIYQIKKLEKELQDEL